jgi:hypothetical protein
VDAIQSSPAVAECPTCVCIPPSLSLRLLRLPPLLRRAASFLATLNQPRRSIGLCAEENNLARPVSCHTAHDNTKGHRHMYHA